MARTDGDEQLHDVLRRLGARLHEQQVGVVRVGGGLRGGDLPLRVQVGLVAGEGDDDVGAALPLQLLHPRLRALERLGRSNIINHDGRLGAAIIAHSK